jgi:23S rRNA (adenine-N6)-dimethyltransferase
MVENYRKSLAQNFLTKSHLAALLVDESSICSNDVVVEIGPGAGILTRELSKRAKKVMAIEKDFGLHLKLKKKFALHDNVILYNADFLRFHINESSYKVFSNIPFNVTSAIMRKLLYGKEPPKEAYLIMQKEAAEKFSGKPLETQFSILAKPWARFAIIRNFKSTDFTPVPKVDIVLLHVEQRGRPLVSAQNSIIYQRFVKHGFGVWKKHLKAAYEPVFTYVQWKKLSRQLHFPLKATPTQLSFEQWLGLFNFLVMARDSKCQGAGDFSTLTSN